MNPNFQSFDDENVSNDFELQALIEGMTLCGKYRLESEAGAGGMGVVWKAWDSTGERWVALKFVPPEIRHSEGAMRQVKQAFQTIQTLNHPNICPVYGLEKDPDFGYFAVMMWLEGQPLNEVSLPKEKIPEVLAKVADALDYAHSERVMHRDVKPSNIFIDKDGKVWLIDFGIAAEIQNSISMNTNSKANRTSGTRPHMAPEQW
ncbi:MAG: serine/threonine protein kinase, partial [Thermoguttaceae bacterium]